MKDIIKHILSLTLFFSITIYVFNPIFFENKELKQHDIEQWKYSANESIEFRKIIILKRNINISIFKKKL